MVVGVVAYSQYMSPDINQLYRIHIMERSWIGVVMILPQVHLRKPCYDFTFL